jgi:large subunit ribosomal protein L23
MDILIKPLVTEKMNDQAERFNRYGFVVVKKATKPEIKKAVETLYNVSVDSVNTMVYGGKVNRDIPNPGNYR